MEISGILKADLPDFSGRVSIKLKYIQLSLLPQRDSFLIRYLHSMKRVVSVDLFFNILQIFLSRLDILIEVHNACFSHLPNGRRSKDEVSEQTKII